MHPHPIRDPLKEAYAASCADLGNESLQDGCLERGANDEVKASLRLMFNPSLGFIHPYRNYSSVFPG